MMEQKLVLMKLLEVSGEIRQEQRGKRIKKEGETRPKREGHTEKEGGGHKLSPVTQSALCLLAEKGSLNQRTIAKSLNVTGQAVSDLVKKLEGREMIAKEAGEHNNENIITLTEKGKEKATEVSQKMETMATELFATFSQEELDILDRLLEKLKEAAVREETK